LTFRFHGERQVTMEDSDGSTEGTWQRVGNQVTLRFYNGKVAYGGTLNGDTLSGRAGNGSTQWGWSLRRQ
jgi:hypothetical protein